MTKLFHLALFCFLGGTALAGCSPDAEPTSISNPALGLRREYWQIFANKAPQNATITYYVLPRPDGADAVVEECASKGPNAARFASLYLCEEPGSVDFAKAEKQLAVINNLSKEDALLLSTFLHQSLRFEARKVEELDGTAFYNVWPYVQERDWIEICKTGAPVFFEGSVKLECERAAATKKNFVGYLYSKEQAEAVAKAMNELYGIAPR